MKTPESSIVLGLMSGTSGDGLDMALVQYDAPATSVPHPGSLLAYHSAVYEPVLREKLLDLLNLTSLELIEAELRTSRLDLHNFWIESVQDFLAKQDVRPDLIASHGQTLWHAPPFSWQWDDAQRWRDHFGISVVSNLRQADLEAGGQGAPLAPLLHAARFRKKTRSSLVLNLGGMANATRVPLGVGFTSYKDWCFGLRGWDCGPANALIDAIVQNRCQQPFDKDGLVAAAGQQDLELIRSWHRSDPWFKLPAPKSTGRDHFGQSYAKRLMDDTLDMSAEDAVATVTGFTAHCVARSLEQEHAAKGVEQLILCGGGACNHTLVQMLETATGLPTVIDPYADAAEAWLVALIGWRTWCGVPSNAPAVTGAGEAVVLGELLR